ncbi:hypothetical protein [Polycladidibacter hongkongensis]|uniref:hypothetical protein n=1 Tax=Polycladidibacter hongkongensis TaxID=1647556 RepID=UPI00083390FA|nr:hypothetical protein [Pseudovibrio hongkongensis]
MCPIDFKGPALPQASHISGATPSSNNASSFATSTIHSQLEVIYPPAGTHDSRVQQIASVPVRSASSRQENWQVLESLVGETCQKDKKAAKDEENLKHLTRHALKTSDPLSGGAACPSALFRKMSWLDNYNFIMTGQACISQIQTALQNMQSWISGPTIVTQSFVPDINYSELIDNRVTFAQLEAALQSTRVKLNANGEPEDDDGLNPEDDIAYQRDKMHLRVSTIQHHAAELKTDGSGEIKKMAKEGKGPTKEASAHTIAAGLISSTTHAVPNGQSVNPPNSNKLETTEA